MIETASLRDAVARLSSGGIVAYPTETVWGLGVIASMPEALEGLRRFKGRADDHAMSVLIPQVAARRTLEALGAQVSREAELLIERYWPGPLTLVFPSAREGDPIGVRCSSHPVAAALANALFDEAPGKSWVMTSTSCNRSGEPPALSRTDALRVCSDGQEAPLVVGGLGEGDEAGGEAPSTVLDLCQAPPRVLREGPLSEVELSSALSRRSG